MPESPPSGLRLKQPARPRPPEPARRIAGDAIRAVFPGDALFAFQAAHDRSDIVALRAEAHSLNGAAGFVGASMLSDLCIRLTDACNTVTKPGAYDKPLLENHLKQIASEYVHHPCDAAPKSISSTAVAYLNFYCCCC